MEMQELLSKRIVKITRPKTEPNSCGLLCFRDEFGNDYIYSAEGDCCSSSWFEHFEGVTNILGHTIMSVEEIELEKTIPIKEIQHNGWTSNEQIDEHGIEHECLRLYGLKILTDRGSAQIEFRNSSNGYYGGYIQFVGTDAKVVDIIDVVEDF